MRRGGCGYSSGGKWSVLIYPQVRSFGSFQKNNDLLKIVSLNLRTRPMPRKSIKNEDERQEKEEGLEEKDDEDVDPKKVASDDDEMEGETIGDDDDDETFEEDEW